MVQNIEDGSPAEVVKLAEQQDVDVLVLTDATEQQVAAVGESALRRQLPHTTIGNGRGSVVWSRYPITADTLISEEGESRAVVLDVPGMAPLDVVAVHPAAPYVRDGSQWETDWEQVLARVANASDDAVTGPVVVVGDLNATSDHWPLRTLAGWGFRDSAEQLNMGLGATWPANGRQQRLGCGVPPLLALDHVLTSPDLVATALVHRTRPAAITGASSRRWHHAAT